MRSSKKVALINLTVELANAYLNLENFIDEFQYDEDIIDHYEVLKQGIKLIKEGQQKVAIEVAKQKPKAKAREQVEFIEDEHIYLINGIETPSVTQLLTRLFPTKYSNIPKHILKEAAEYGTRIHKAIENYEKGIEQGLTIMEEVAIEEYKTIKQRHKLKALKTEQIVNFGKVYAGTYDILAKREKLKILIDTKTTAELDKEYLSWQLSLYNYAMRHKDKASELWCLWLPKKGAAEFVQIELKPDHVIEEFLKEFINGET